MKEILKKLGIIKTKVILDTNFLMIPGTLGIDIFTEIKRIVQEPVDICVLDQTIQELEKLMTKSKGKESFNAKLGYIMVKQKSLKTIKGSLSYVDDSIVDYIKRYPTTIVATQDKLLKAKVKQQKVRVIYLKQKKYLELG